MKVLCIVTVLAALISAGAVHARTWYIMEDGTGDAPTITAGLDSASTGDTVLVASGTYLTTCRPETRIDVNKGICLLSEAGPEFTTVEMCSTVVGITVCGCDGARVSGFTVRYRDEAGCIPGMGWPTGIGVWNCLDAVVENCVIPDILAYGIDIGGTIACTDLVVIRGNSIISSVWGIRCDGELAAVAPLIEDNTITDCQTGVFVVSSSPSIRGNSITYSNFTGMEFSGECHGDCTRNTVAHCGQPGGEPYPHGGVWMWSEDARPTFNVSEVPAEANSFYGNYTCDIGMEPPGDSPEVYAVANYWGCKCPDFSERFIGSVVYWPWVDSTCTRFITPPECPGAVEPVTWGQIKALFK